MRKIAVSTSSFGEYDASPIELCRQKGYEVSMNPYRRKLNPVELVGFAKDAVGLIAGTEEISASALERLPDLKVISRCGVGTDNIDLGATKRLNIKVFNTPDAPTVSVAELIVGLATSLLRGINRMDALLKRGKWNKIMGSLIYGKKIGIVGFGRIGQKVAGLLSAFGAEISYYDIEPKRSLGGYKAMDLGGLLAWADIIVLTLAPEAGLGPIIRNKELQMMKQGAYMINASRGGVIDEKALHDALVSGHLAGAALDVFEKEPYEGALTKLDNVLLTPHIGSYSRESRIEMERQAVLNLLKGLED